jgi:hypothetical protein
MTKYNVGDKVRVKVSGEIVIITKIETQLSSGRTFYQVNVSGDIWSENDFEPIEPAYKPTRSMKEPVEPDLKKIPFTIPTMAEWEKKTEEANQMKTDEFNKIVSAQLERC